MFRKENIPIDFKKIKGSPYLTLVVGNTSLVYNKACALIVIDFCKKEARVNK